MVIPCKSFDVNDNAEKEVWEKFRGRTIAGVTTFHSFHIEDQRIPLIIINPQKGIIVVEIRGYDSSETIKIQDKKYIRIANEPPVLAPVPTGLQNRQKVLGLLENVGVSPKAIGVASMFPKLNREGYIGAGLNKICPETYTVLKEDLNDGKALEDKLQGMLDGIFKSLSEKEKEGLNQKLLSAQELIKGLFPKNELEQESLSKEIEVRTKKQQYFEIAKFLMRNKVRDGFIICSSQELLDGLGDYFTDIEIPWHYREAENMPGAAGYCLTDEPLKKSTDKARVLIEKVSRDRLRIFVNDTATLPLKISEEKVEIDFDINKMPLHLKNEEIRAVFLKAFDVAKEEIDIICPWMNFGVVNEAFIDRMDRALKRGVKIKIEYGLNPNQNDYDISRSMRSDQVAERLKGEFQKYSDKFQIRRDNIHYKLVLCDELFKLEGGFNYLSFLGDYSDEGTRREGSPFGRDPEEIKYLRKEYFTDGWKP